MPDKPLVASVVFETSLPQLDHSFDYLVPAELKPLAVAGVRVIAPVGRGKQLLDGYIIALNDTSEFAGKLQEIAEIISPLPVLTSSVLELCRQVARRQAVTLGEVLKTAVPARAVRTEQSWLKLDAKQAPGDLSLKGSNQQSKSSREAQLHYLQSSTVAIQTSDGLIPSWCERFLERAKTQLEQGKSVIVALPDFRDFNVFHQLALTRFGNLVIDYRSDQTRSRRYESFLRALATGASLIVGNRNVLYAPIENLGEIQLWDDGDPAYQDQSSPYLHTRELALMRQKNDGCNLLIASFHPSTETTRLLQIGYLQRLEDERQPPKLTYSDSPERIDSSAISLIRESIKNGNVLIQVSAKGFASGYRCADCGSIARCESCHGPLWSARVHEIICRWCGRIHTQIVCHKCNSVRVRQVGTGSSRTSAEFGTMFPGSRIVESTGEKLVESVSGKGVIVIASPGAEPRSKSGYDSVILLDANRLLSRDSMRSTESAIRNWVNAISLLKPGGRAHLVGVSADLGSKLSLWSLEELSLKEYQERVELRLPPAVRIASVVGTDAQTAQVSESCRIFPSVELIGPTKQVGTDQWQLLIRYPYLIGLELADHLKALQLQLFAGVTVRSSKTGRSSRAVRIKMDDFDIL